MSYNISSFPIGSIFYQSGKGLPTHIATRGCTYIDIDTGTMYINKDGLIDWEELLDNPVDYIHFNTGLTQTYNGGDLFWDDSTNSLAYKPYTINNDVTVNLGQENLIRIFNQTGSQINNGKAVTVTGASSNIPSVSLAIASDGDSTLYKVSGVATHDIPNNSYGFITQFGVVNDINLSGFQIGERIYLSQTNAGDFVSFSGLSYTGRTSEIGVVLNNTTNGKLKVSIINESPFSNITQLESNILNTNNSSTGVFEFSGISKTSNTTFSVAPAKGWIIDNTTNPTSPTLKFVNYSGATNIDSPYRTTNTITYLLLTSGSTLMMQPTVPTPKQRRQNIFLGKIGHPDKTNFSIAFQVVDFDISPVSQLRDMFIPIPLINNGIYPYPNTNLTFNNTAGTLYGLGINFPVDSLNPNSISVSAQTPVSFQYRTQSGGTLTTTTIVDPAYYDNAGVKTIIPAPAKQATNQRVFLLQDGSFRIQYGQTVYADLTTALAAVQTETFNTFPNWRDNGILIAILSLRSDTTNLADTNYARFLFVSKFGESVGAAGGLSTTNLQQAYNNSTTPEIIINSTLDGLSIKNGTGNPDSSTNLLEGINTSGATTSYIKADGDISGTTIQTNGFRANNNGLTATTVSATTYENLPTDIRVTGATYSNNTFTFTNNTGGTFNVLFNTMTGLTVNGNLIITGSTSATLTGLTVNGNTIVTGNTSLQGVTATTVSATTYQNLPIKYYAEFSGAPSTSPIVLGTDSISIGNGAQSRSTYMLSFGTNAGKNATGTTVSNFIGSGAGYDASGSTYVNFIGPNAGYGAINANSSTFLNSASGNFSTGATYSNFFGTSAGESSKDLNYSNVLGYQAGLGVTNAQNVNYFGRQSGWYATNATFSNFIGFGAGTSATNASYSNFIGSNAGTQASNASFSNLIGFNAGKLFVGNNIGSNNIIIGTNISLPSGATNSINIGGVLFGTGTYSNTGTDPSIIPSDGKIGINVVSPSTTLDVSGTARITNGLTADTVSATTITLGGNITMSNRPAFSVFGSGTTSNLTTTQNGSGTLNTNNFGLSYSQGTGFDISTGIFTAPVAGLYHVTLIGRNSGYSSGISQLAVLKNNSNANGNVMMVEWGSSSSMNHTGGAQIFKLAVNDTLRLRVLAGQVNFDGNDNWSVAYIG